MKRNEYIKDGLQSYFMPNQNDKASIYNVGSRIICKMKTLDILLNRHQHYDSRLILISNNRLL